jgi:hypothetical protein
LTAVFFVGLHRAAAWHVRTRSLLVCRHHHFSFSRFVFPVFVLKDCGGILAHTAPQILLVQKV